MRQRHLVAAAVITVGLATQAAAQTGRVQGVVRDINGEPIKGATVTASHPDASPGELTAVTDDNGRFAILGLRSVTTWHFVAEAPGFFPTEGNSAVRTQIIAPLIFTLRPDPGPLPGALTGDIQQRLTVANALRNEGRYDEAIAAYQAIQAGNNKLTMVNLVLADIYRQQAGQDPDSAARRTLLERALAAYDAVLEDDAAHERARTERAAVAADLTALTN